MNKALLPLCIALSLAGCDGEKKAAPAAAPAGDKAPGANTPGDAKAPGNTKAPMAHGGGTPGNPHGGAPAAHGGATPPAGNPHGGMKAGAPAPAKAGPPRDITPSGDVVAETLAEFAVSVPKEWEKGQPSGMMRMAQWVVPGPGGDGELVVYRFKGGAGGVEANMTRWKGQFTPPEGKTLEDISKLDKKTVGALTMHTLDVTGRYVAAMMPGADEKHDKPEHRMLAAIIEGSGDPLFFKATGPAKTLDVWAPAWATMLGTVKTGD
ncbi:MAG: hypothetical protein KUG77_09845 [Nannocystaceae bacterium]|nr:hypothetical protein [Nannocystaceae bacterium]